MDLIHNLHALHFLRPAWLIAWPVLIALTVWLARRRSRESQWATVIDADLLPALQLQGGEPPSSRSPWPWLALTWSLTTFALAGPSWQHENSAAYRAPDAWVIVLDLSPSMSSADVAPSRATRARYAISDLLDAAHGTRVGLIAFSDDAYIVTPLTDDMATVRALLPPLAPDIMPSPGDHLAPALDQARQLLDRTATRGGHVIVLSDGFDDQAAALTAASRLKTRGTAVDVIAVGPYAMNKSLLQQLASAGGGQATDLNGVSEWVNRLQPALSREATRVEGMQTAKWFDAGVWLLPPLVLLVALWGRRGWL